MESEQNQEEIAKNAEFVAAVARLHLIIKK
jgi:hypothetical protein